MKFVKDSVYLGGQDVCWVNNIVLSGLDASVLPELTVGSDILPKLELVVNDTVISSSVLSEVPNKLAINNKIQSSHIRMLDNLPVSGQLVLIYKKLPLPPKPNDSVLLAL